MAATTLSLDIENVENRYGMSIIYALPTFRRYRIRCSEVGKTRDSWCDVSRADDRNKKVTGIHCFSLKTSLTRISMNQCVVFVFADL